MRRAKPAKLNLTASPAISRQETPQYRFRYDNAIGTMEAEAQAQPHPTAASENCAPKVTKALVTPIWIMASFKKPSGRPAAERACPAKNHNGVVNAVAHIACSTGTEPSHLDPKTS